MGKLSWFMSDINRNVPTKWKWAQGDVHWDLGSVWWPVVTATRTTDPPFRTTWRLLTIVKRRKLQWYGHVSHSSGLAKTILLGHSERGKKTRQTEEELGRQHQGMDRPGNRQVPEGSGEQGKMEETGCEIICGAPTTLMVEGYMMMMMITATEINFFSTLSGKKQTFSV